MLFVLAHSSKSSTEEDEDDLIIQWLDKKEPSSTVFVSFGSEYFLTKEEIKESHVASSLAALISYAFRPIIIAALISYAFRPIIIAVPMHLDQPVNARLMNKIGIGVEVERQKDSRIEGEGIAMAIRNVVRGKAGQAARIREREMSNKIKENEGKVLDGVVDELAKL